MILTSREDWNEPSDSSVELKQEEPEVLVKVKGKQDGDTLRSDQSSQADWIRQYMRRQEEVHIRMVQLSKSILHYSSRVAPI